MMWCKHERSICVFLPGLHVEEFLSLHCSVINQQVNFSHFFKFFSRKPISSQFQFFITTLPDEGTLQVKKIAIFLWGKFDEKCLHRKCQIKLIPSSLKHLKSVWKPFEWHQHWRGEVLVSVFHCGQVVGKKGPEHKLSRNQQGKKCQPKLRWSLTNGGRW